MLPVLGRLRFERRQRSRVFAAGRVERVGDRARYGREPVHRGGRERDVDGACGKARLVERGAHRASGLVGSTAVEDWTTDRVVRGTCRMRTLLALRLGFKVHHIIDFTFLSSTLISILRTT